MNIEFIRLTASFKEWLGIVGYSPDTVESQPRVIEKYFSFMESNNIIKLENITRQATAAWYESEKQRKSKQTGELLKNATLNGFIRSLRLFSQFLDETSLGTLTIDLLYEENAKSLRPVLTKEEVQSMYHAADETILGLRDRAILSIYYGCGIRSKEGQFLELSDIILERKLVYVRKGKQYRERYVPFVQNQMTDFKLYLKECRPELTTAQTKNWFLLNNKGNQCDASFLLKRVKLLAKQAEIQKEIGVHTLRHSIATHLMQSGMKIESIAQFLGHKNIDSTQRYVHLAIEMS